jgi:hypothetical protein
MSVRNYFVSWSPETVIFRVARSADRIVQRKKTVHNEKRYTRPVKRIGNLVTGMMLIYT